MKKELLEQIVKEERKHIKRGSQTYLCLMSGEKYKNIVEELEDIDEEQKAIIDRKIKMFNKMALLAHKLGFPGCENYDYDEDIVVYRKLKNKLCFSHQAKDDTSIYWEFRPEWFDLRDGEIVELKKQLIIEKGVINGHI